MKKIIVTIAAVAAAASFSACTPEEVECHLKGLEKCYSAPSPTAPVTDEKVVEAPQAPCDTCAPNGNP